MLKRELKVNRKSLIIFLGILAISLLGVALLYPSLITDTKQVDEMLKMFSKELLESFNMDIISLSSVFGWYASEGYTFITLISGCYFAILGGTILLKEQDQKTIDFLYSKPISKNKIITNKLLTGLIYLVIFNLVVGLTLQLGLVINKEDNVTKCLLLTIAPLILDTFFFFSSFFISIFLKKVNTGMTSGIGLVFIMYILNILGSLSDKIKVMKYASIFYYMDSRQIIKDTIIHPLNIAITLGVVLILTISSYCFYNKKELGL